jgi:hypothetical protein
MKAFISIVANLRKQAVSRFIDRVVSLETNVSTKALSLKIQ